MNRETIVISGLGVVSPFGAGKPSFVAGIRNGASAAGAIGRFDTSRYRSRKACLITETGFRAADGSLGRLPLVYQYGFAAAQECIEDSRLNLNDEDKDRIGIFFGTACNADQTERYHTTLIEKGPNLVSPLLFQNTTYMAGPGTLSIKHHITGPSIALPGGYSSGIQALDMAVSFVADRRIDIALVVAADELSRLHFEALAALKLLAVQTRECDEASRPFDAQRNGIIAGEGAGAIVIERASHARRRGARVYAEVAGVGLSNDAYRAADISPQGIGLENAMRVALEESHASPNEVAYIAAAANSTKRFDQAEVAAIKRLFKAQAFGVAISSVKSMLGETFAAGSILNIIACVVAINHRFVPPTINYHNADPACDLDFVPNEPRMARVEVAMANSYSFGGGCGSVIIRAFRRFEHEETQ